MSRSVEGGPYDRVTLMAWLRIEIGNGPEVQRMQQAINVMHGYPDGKVPLADSVAKEHEDAHFKLMRSLHKVLYLPVHVDRDGTIHVPTVEPEKTKRRRRRCVSE